KLLAQLLQDEVVGGPDAVTAAIALEEAPKRAARAAPEGAAPWQPAGEVAPANRRFHGLVAVAIHEGVPRLVVAGEDGIAPAEVRLDWRRVGHLQVPVGRADRRFLPPVGDAGYGMRPGSGLAGESERAGTYGLVLRRIPGSGASRKDENEDGDIG